MSGVPQQSSVALGFRHQKVLGAPLGPQDTQLPGTATAQDHTEAMMGYVWAVLGSFVAGGIVGTVALMVFFARNLP